MKFYKILPFLKFICIEKNEEFSFKRTIGDFFSLRTKDLISYIINTCIPGLMNRREREKPQQGNFMSQSMEEILFGGEKYRDGILKLLRERNMEFEHLIHEETPTSADSARVRGTLLEEGIKSLILLGRNTKKNYHFNLPSHLKLDMKAIFDITLEKCDFEDPSVILERFGIKIGGVPPFGNLLHMETFFDERIKSLTRVAFNCGLRTESIIMKGNDLITLVQPRFGNFAKT
jgi:prolyl-tRNA editing enzyme YbaK/EbsC (Cys-tRNA(Pro) deacylase)